MVTTFEGKQALCEICFRTNGSTFPGSFFCMFPGDIPSVLPKPLIEEIKSCSSQTFPWDFALVCKPLWINNIIVGNVTHVLDK